MYIRFLPGTLPPLYQELHDGWTRTVDATSEVAWSIHSCCAVDNASMVRIPLARICVMQSQIQSTCCSRAATKLVAALGLPGPWLVNRIGKPTSVSPRYNAGPSVAQYSPSEIRS